jgi:FkbM family methyltransferase
MEKLIRRALASPGLSRISRSLYGLPGYARVARFASRSLLARRGRVLTSRAGYPLWVDGRTYESVVRYLRDDYEPELTALVSALLDEGGSFVDIGANIGHYTLVAASVVGPGGWVCAVEPDPETFYALERNVAVAGCENVECVDLAVLDSARDVRLYRSGLGGALNSVYDSSITGARPVMVRSTTLDELVAGRRVDGVKIDVEGAEQDVLRGARTVLEANPDAWVIVEWRPWFAAQLTGGGPFELPEELWRSGLRTVLLDHDGRAVGELTTADPGLDHSANYNLLAARDPEKLLERVASRQRDVAQATAIPRT